MKNSGFGRSIHPRMDKTLRSKAENEILKAERNGKVIEAVQLYERLTAMKGEIAEARRQNDRILKELAVQADYLRTENSQLRAETKDLEKLGGDSRKLGQVEKSISDLEAEHEALRGENSRLEDESKKVSQEREECRKENAERKLQLGQDIEELQAENERLRKELDAAKFIGNPDAVQREDAASTLEYLGAAGGGQESSTNEEIIAELRSELARLEADKTQRLEKRQQMHLKLESTKRRGAELNQELEAKTKVAAGVSARMSEMKTKEEGLHDEIRQVRKGTDQLRGDNQELEERRLPMKLRELSELSSKFEAAKQGHSRNIDKLKAGAEEKQRQIESLRDFNGEAEGMRGIIESDRKEDEAIQRHIEDLLADQRMVAIGKVESVEGKLSRMKEMVNARTSALMDSTHQLRSVVSGWCGPIEAHIWRCLEELQVVRAETAALDREKQSIASEKAELVTRVQDLGGRLLKVEEEAKYLTQGCSMR